MIVSDNAICQPEMISNSMYAKMILLYQYVLTFLLTTTLVPTLLFTAEVLKTKITISYCRKNY